MNKAEWIRENETRPEYRQQWPNYKQRCDALAELYDRTGGELPKPKKKAKKKAKKTTT